MRLYSVLAVALLVVQVSAWSDNRTWSKVPKYTLNMDLPQKDRWTEIVADYKQDAPAILVCFRTSCFPKIPLPCALGSYSRCSTSAGYLLNPCCTELLEQHAPQVGDANCSDNRQRREAILQGLC